MNLACVLIFIVGWLAMAGYMNYQIWLKPDEVWQIRQENAARSSETRSFLRFLRFDPLRLGSNRGRFIWFERVVAGLVLLAGILMLAGVIAQVIK